MLKKLTAFLLAGAMICSFAACRAAPSGETATPVQSGPVETVAPVQDGAGESGGIVTSLEKIDMSKWQYHEDDDIYYQIGISYCETPVAGNYETLAIFVPGAYFSATENGDGTYACVVNAAAMINGYAAKTAPIVMPIETPGYSAMAALTAYTNVTEYTKEGFVYVHAGCRGRDDGAPAGVTDLKAAIRYLRYNDDVVAGSAERIFVFGMSGGGAQSALVGATGDSALYEPYLEQIGAVQGVSDAVYGSMCWCPITNLDSADAAYEWMMGATRSGLSAEEQAISDALAAAFAGYINQAGIKDEDGNVLILEPSESGIYQAGSYYDYMVGVIESSLNDFLSDTEFPYNASASSKMGRGPGGMGGFGGRGGNGGFGGPGDVPYEEKDGIARAEITNGVTSSGIYETPEDYIDSLNANGTWIIYDAATNTAGITSVEAFAKAFKSASKSLGAFDQLNAGQGENTLFGYGDGKGAHFDAALSEILKDLGSGYAADFAADLQKTDSVGYTVDQRLNMYTPLYYLLESQEGYGAGTPAKYWRIRSGIAQSDTSITTEANLALALMNYDGVESVDFATVWGQQHVKAERTGDSTTNFINWVHNCLA